VPGGKPAPETLLAGIEWRDVIAELAETRPLLRRLNNRSALTANRPGGFLVEAFDEITKKAAEDARALVETIVSRRAGLPLRMECRLRSGDPKSTGGAGRNAGVETDAVPDPEALAKQIAATFNIHVEIEP
jgi:hypothetical protein